MQGSGPSHHPCTGVCAKKLQRHGGRVGLSTPPVARCPPFRFLPQRRRGPHPAKVWEEAAGAEAADCGAGQGARAGRRRRAAACVAAQAGEEVVADHRCASQDEREEAAGQGAEGAWSPACRPVQVWRGREGRGQREAEQEREAEGGCSRCRVGVGGRGGRRRPRPRRPVAVKGCCCGWSDNFRPRDRWWWRSQAAAARRETASGRRSRRRRRRPAGQGQRRFLRNAEVPSGDSADYPYLRLRTNCGFKKHQRLQNRRFVRNRSPLVSETDKLNDCAESLVLPRQGMAANFGTSSLGQEQKTRITLKGSTAIVTEFFGANINEPCHWASSATVPSDPRSLRPPAGYAVNR